MSMSSGIPAAVTCRHGPRGRQRSRCGSTTSRRYKGDGRSRSLGTAHSSTPSGAQVTPPIVASDAIRPSFIQLHRIVITVVTKQLAVRCGRTIHVPPSRRQRPGLHGSIWRSRPRWGAKYHRDGERSSPPWSHRRTPQRRWEPRIRLWDPRRARRDGRALPRCTPRHRSLELGRPMSLVSLRLADAPAG